MHASSVQRSPSSADDAAHLAGWICSLHYSRDVSSQHLQGIKQALKHVGLRRGTLVQVVLMLTALINIHVQRQACAMPIKGVQ